MAEEENLDFELDQIEDDEKVKRIRNLSEKVKLTSQERDEAKQKASETEARLLELEKERDFHKGFTQASAKYQGATEFQDKIWDKVKSGYDIEDATIAVLNKEGKFQAPAQAPTQQSNPAGGSAPNQVVSGEKPLSEMTLAEKRAMLLESEKRGEISWT